MPPRLPPGDERDQAIRDLHDAGMSLTAVADNLGIDKATVSRRAKALGITWDRSQTKAATEAKKADNASRRANLEEQCLIDAERMLKQLWAPAQLHSFGGKDNVHNSVDVDQPIFADQRHIAQSASTLLSAANKLRDMTVDSEAADVDKWTAAMLGRPEPTAADTPEILG